METGKRNLQFLNNFVTCIKFNFNEISELECATKPSDVDTRIRVSKKNRKDNNPIAQDKCICVSQDSVDTCMCVSKVNDNGKNPLPLLFNDNYYDL